MTDRRIGLETSIPQGMPDLSQSGAGSARGEASDTDRQAFERALSQGDDGQQVRAEAEQAAETPRPFGLFGSLAAAPAGQAAAGAAPEGLAQSLSTAADRLLVGDGGSGRREVRIDLKDEILPGVTVSVYEDEGRLVAAFACASEASREKLCACAQTLAAEMAQSLSRPALVRVTTDDPEDPCLFEATAAAP
jgi:hypothetical protein